MAQPNAKRCRMPPREGARHGVALLFKVAQAQNLGGAGRKSRTGKPVGATEEVEVVPHRQIQV
jgi:hypothetical protein